MLHYHLHRTVCFIKTTTKCLEHLIKAITLQSNGSYEIVETVSAQVAYRTSSYHDNARLVHRKDMFHYGEQCCGGRGAQHTPVILRVSISPPSLTIPYCLPIEFWGEIRRDCSGSLGAVQLRRRLPLVEKSSLQIASFDWTDGRWPVVPWRRKTRKKYFLTVDVCSGQVRMPLNLTY